MTLKQTVYPDSSTGAVASQLKEAVWQAIGMCHQIITYGCVNNMTTEIFLSY
jgi:hypothetical protein